MCTFFQSDLLSLLNMKKISMGKFDDYTKFSGLHHCIGNEQLTCYASASASIYVPWTTTNAAAIISSINILSQYFAIYPLSSKDMRHNILFDVTITANVFQSTQYFDMTSPKLKVIQNEVAKFSSSLTCPLEVGEMLHLLDDRFGLENIGYVCFKVLGCRHASYSSSTCTKGFGMTLGGFFFPCFEKHNISERLCLNSSSSDEVTSCSVGVEKISQRQMAGSKHSYESLSSDSSSDSEECFIAKRKARKQPSFFEDSDEDSESENVEEILLNVDSSISEENSYDLVRPGVAIREQMPDIDDVVLMPLISDDESRDVKSKNGV